jgi:Pyruvate/2-oxoacid:ferredoxin oxidoreductase delta subunit
MCEFCTIHGEGKKWYLQMKNYADVLLHEELSSSEKEIVKATTRLEWKYRRFKNFTMPAITGVSKMQDDLQGAPSSTEPPTVQPSEDEVMANRKFKHFGQVLPIEDVEEVIDMADSITRLPCGCRFITTGKTDQRYCFGFGLDKSGILGKFPDATSSLEVLDKEETKSIFRKYDEEGLVHSIWTGVTPYVNALCNCDRDCRPYDEYIVKGGSPRFFRAEYICEIDWDFCKGCKSCMSQCQFGAQFYSSALSKVYIDPTRCFGCGVCRAECSNEAIRLVPRDENPEAANIWLRNKPR